MENRALPFSEPDFRALFQSAPGLYLVLTPDLTIVAVSDAYLRATMTDRTSILGRRLFDVFPDNPEDPAADGMSNLRSSLQRVLQHRVVDTMPTQKYDIRKPESEGGAFEERFWSPVNSPVFGPDKEVLYIIHRVEDVTEFVRLKKRGIEQDKVLDDLRGEERFRKAFDANPEPITICTASDGRYIDVNQTFLRVTGYRREETIGRTAWDLGFLTPGDHAELVALMEKQGAVRDLEVTFRLKSGEQRTGLKSAEIIEVAGQKCIIAILQDVTEKRSLEGKLRQAQKMEAVGQLTGGIAHDFNNLLSVIIGYAEIIEQELPPHADLQKECRQIKKAGERAASLTRQLLAFSRQQVLRPRIIDLNAVVLDVEKMLRRLIGEHIDFNTALHPLLGSIKVDPIQVEQVIMNLALNSRDAMPQGGRLTIETANVDVDERYSRTHGPQQPGPYVVLTVSDTGVGMDEATKARIFDPFFTTKEVGKGTGLGLSTVYGVVKQSGGYVWVYSELKLGTTFKIYFPRLAAAPEAEKPRSAVNSLRGTETILLVEDEESLRELAHALLVNSGYNVIAAQSPFEAIEFARSNGHIDLLLTDVVMPGMNGRVLGETLAIGRPGMKVVYMSGYSGFSHVGLLDPEAILVQKPLTQEKLLRAVREAMDGTFQL